jgi:hypothetical protein
MSDQTLRYLGANLVYLVFWMSPVVVAFILRKTLRWSLCVVCLVFFALGAIDQLGVHPVSFLGYEPDWSWINPLGWLVGLAVAVMAKSEK